ncbi:hypothetical protein [Bacteroides heparinolyticus]|uniref:hypothetical protein n=1 Tax=Prevotella heparinolytica TaxID=28113 RepID=UPI00359FB80E
MADKNSTLCSIGEKEYLTPEEAAAWTGCSIRALDRFRDMGLKIIKVNKTKTGKVLYKKEHLREFLDAFVE